jgi:uridine kinase
MIVDIILKLQPDAEPQPMSVESGTSLEALVRLCQRDLPYTVIGALVNNRLEELGYVIGGPCTVTFLDMRYNAADRMYQRSLCLLYLTAIRDVLGEVGVDIRNSLNRGLYSEIRSDSPVTDEQLPAIERRMRELVKRDEPILRTVMNRSAVIAWLKALGSAGAEKADLLEQSPEVHYIAVYELTGYRNYFYGQLAPSTGYLKYFELHRYMNGMLLRYPHPSKPDALPRFVNDNKLYEAFDEGWDIARLFGLSFAGDINQEIADGNLSEIIAIAERLHRAKIEQMAKMIKESGKRIVLLAGPSSSGKTTSARRLSGALEDMGVSTFYLGTDDYFLDREQTPLDADGSPNYEGLEAIDVRAFNEDMNGLISGQEVDLPTFDFIEGRRKYGMRVTRLAPGQTVIIEGIHALNAHLSEHIATETKFKIYISPLTQLNLDDHNRIPTTDVRLLRRMVRDNRTRGNSVVDTIRQWPKVRRGEDVNIFPYNGEADVVFNSALIYELAFLRAHAESLLMQVMPDDAEYGDACRLLDFLRFFRPSEDEGLIPADSILREFIGGGLI